MFTRVLMKYLEQKDPSMHSRAKVVIKECAERNKNGDPQYASLTTSMQTRLRNEVGEVYWKKAEDYLNHFLKQKLRQAQVKQAQAAAAKQQQAGVASGTAVPRSAVPAGVGPSTIKSGNVSNQVQQTPNQQNQPGNISQPMTSSQVAQLETQRRLDAERKNAEADRKRAEALRRRKNQALARWVSRTYI